jgi:hypothetical protein
MVSGMDHESIEIRECRSQREIRAIRGFVWDFERVNNPGAWRNGSANTRVPSGHCQREGRHGSRTVSCTSPRP